MGWEGVGGQPLYDKAVQKPGRAEQVKAESCDSGGVSGDRLKQSGTKNSLECPPSTMHQSFQFKDPGIPGQPTLPMLPPPQFTHTLATLKLLLTELKPSVAGAGDSHTLLLFPLPD